MRKNELQLPIYYQIAVDIAGKIAAGEYVVGNKIYARSLIASQYAISSETARRAINVLADLNIVETEKGSGVTIKSLEKAEQFVKQAQKVDTVNTLKNDLVASFDRHFKEMKTLYSDFVNFIESMERFRKINPFAPFRIKINKNAYCLNKTVAETNFWHKTTATIVAIKRGDNIIISPGPYASFEENDVFYFVGDEDTYQKVMRFLYLDK